MHDHGECDSRERRGHESAHRRAAGKAAGALARAARGGGQPANAMGGLAAGAAGRTNKSVDDVAAGRTVFDEVAPGRLLRTRLAKANPTRFVQGECLACGHVGIVNRRTLFERVLCCSKCGALGLPRIVERGG